MLRHKHSHHHQPTPLPPHNQRMYHYAGPPSIPVSTWKDRSHIEHVQPPVGRVHIIPGTPMSVPVVGHGVVVPPASRMASAYHSLQYGSEVDGYPNPYGHDPKYTRDAHDEQLRLQLKKSERNPYLSPRDTYNSSPRPWTPRNSSQIIKNIDLKYGDHHNEDDIQMNYPKTASVVPARKSSGQRDHTPSKMGQYIEEISLKKTSDLRPVSKTLSSDSAISNGSSSEGLSTLADKSNQSKPQFYFGQNVSIVKSSPFLEQQQQSAIEKVKLNETLTHPKLKSEENRSTGTKVNSNGNNLSVITVEDANNDSEESNRKKSTSVSPGLSSTVSSLSSPTSSSSSSSSYSKNRLSHLNNKNISNPVEEEEFLVPRPKQSFSSSQNSIVSSVRPSRNSVPTFGSPASYKNDLESAQDQSLRAFELELAAGKSRLRKPSTGSSNSRPTRPLTSVFDVQEVGMLARPPPAPIPPPLPPTPGRVPAPPKPPPTVSLRPVNGEIPLAPKLTHFGAPAAEPQRKGMVAPNGLSAREELMQAIRGKGGFQGLRKTNSGKNL